MRWRWKRARNSVSLADVSSRIRGFLLDSQINDAHELALTLGCTPISDEVALMEEEVKTTMSSVAKYEQVKKFVLLPALFSIQEGELTPTLKLKRKIIYAKYEHLVLPLYN